MGHIVLMLERNHDLLVVIYGEFHYFSDVIVTSCDLRWVHYVNDVIVF